MSIKKILVDVPDNRFWDRDKTIAIVFDNNGKQIADFDLVTGINIENIDGNLFMTIDEEIVPMGTLMFRAAWAEFKEDAPAEKFSYEEIIPIQKEKEKDRIVKEKPWDYKGSGDTFVSFSEREKRISVCRSCELFNHSTGICEINGMDAMLVTKSANYYCPEGKWDKGKNADPNFTPYVSAQDEFEEEFEKYLEENA